VSTLSFRQKLWIPLICSLLCITGIVAFDAIQTRNIRIEERRNDLTNIDDVGLNVVKYFGALADSGALTQQEAQKEAMSAIKGMRYGKDGYIAINNFDGAQVMNPMAPEKDGKSEVDFKDANGTYIFRETIAIGQSESGTGFIRYIWPHPGQTENVPKLSRVVAYKPWGWTLVTGVYMDDIDIAFNHSLMLSGGVLAGTTALLVLIVSVINRSLHRTIGGSPEYAAEVAAKIADNDLRLAVDTVDGNGDSVLFAMKTMQANLVATISEIRRGADNIASASSQIASGSMDLSSRTEAQASSLEETAASMEELTSTVKQNADNAQTANDLAESAYDTAEKTNAMVAQLVNNMSEIDSKAAKIGDIIGVIDGIAFQTNILALNAAVEAARAGEQGRGFAVVAAEVRNLAKRSADAAREIKTLIGSADSTVRAGVELTDEVGRSMHEIMDGSKRVSKIISEISTASREQASGIEQVTVAVSQMDDVTQKNAALVEESAAAANLMQEQAAQLQQLVSIFRFEENIAVARSGERVLKLSGAVPRSAPRQASASPAVRRLSTRAA
jgi:methyl-accepting chemotaxis protein